jgi:hypothetical protein
VRVTKKQPEFFCANENCEFHVPVTQDGNYVELLNMELDRWIMSGRQTVGSQMLCDGCALKARRAAGE